MSNKAETLDYLRKVRALIERGWHQGGQAIDDTGERCAPRDGRAVAWCILGACNAVSATDCVPLEHGTYAFDGWVAIRHSVRDVAGSMGIMSWNDTEGRTKEEVLDLIDRTIARVESDGEPCQK